MSDDTSSAPSVVIERTIEAAPDLIWQMWTDPEHFKAWYGPQGCTIPVAELDVTVGGTRFVGMEMQTPDGAMTMWFTGEHREIIENERLVYSESMADEDGNVLSAEQAGMPEGHPTTTEVIVELEERAGATKMVMTHVGVPEDSPGAAGWNMALDKLVDHLATQ